MKKYNQGKNNARFIDGRCSKNYYCSDCHKKISLYSGLYGKHKCKICSENRSQKGKLNGNFKNWKTKERNFCKYCGKKLSQSSYYQKIEQCASCERIDRWKDMEYKNRVIAKTIKSCGLKPNKPEKFLIVLFKNLGLRYDYVGTGDLILDGLCPDFVNRRNKRIIEFYGTYWHRRGKRKQDIRRVKVYRKYGYKTLIIWEHELKDIASLIEKVRKFR